MTPLIRKYKTLSYREVTWRLRKENLPETLVMQTVEALRAERAEQHKRKLSARASNKAWGEVIEALQHERRIVRSMVRYKTAEPAPERDEDRKSTRLNSSHSQQSRMPSSA